MIDRSNRILLVMDLSNFEYQAAFAAKRDWEKGFPEESSFLSDPREADQENLPNLLNFQNFRRVLSRTVQAKFENALNIAKKWHQTEIDSAEGMDVFLTEDSPLSGNFRKRLYPEYKSHRKNKKLAFDVFKVLDYTRNVLFKDLGLEDRLGYKIVKVAGCESDDIIAVLMERYRDYMCRILISSDRDYLQLEGINQYDGFGAPVRPVVKATNREIELDPKDYLVWKIVRGDVSDNIKGVFPGYGDVKSAKLAQDRDLLKKMLLEDNSAALRFRLNKRLIDFRQIPEKAKARIAATLDEKMGEIVLPEKVDFGSCITIRKEG